MVLRQRFFVIDVEGRDDLAGLNGGDESEFVDERASRRIDQDRAPFHAGDILGPDEATRVWRQNHVHGDDVGAAHEIRFADEDGAGFLSLRGGKVRTPGHNLHIERERGAGETRPKAAKTHNTEGFSG